MDCLRRTLGRHTRKASNSPVPSTDPAFMCATHRASSGSRQFSTPTHRHRCRRGRWFPARSVRDLIGVARLLYRTWAKSSAHDSRSRELVSIGRDLQRAITIARCTKPWTPQYSKACELAEIAAGRLGQLVDVHARIEPLIAVALDRAENVANIGKVARKSR